MKGKREMDEKKSEMIKLQIEKNERKLAKQIQMKLERIDATDEEVYMCMFICLYMRVYKYM